MVCHPLWSSPKQDAPNVCSELFVGEITKQILAYSKQNGIFFPLFNLNYNISQTQDIKTHTRKYMSCLHEVAIINRSQLVTTSVSRELLLMLKIVKSHQIKIGYSPYKANILCFSDDDPNMIISNCLRFCRI